MKSRITLFILAACISVALGQATQPAVSPIGPSSLRTLLPALPRIEQLRTENLALLKEATNLLTSNMLELTRRYIALKGSIPAAAPTTQPTFFNDDLLAKIRHVAPDPHAWDYSEVFIYDGPGGKDMDEAYTRYELTYETTRNVRLRAMVEQQTAIQKLLAVPQPATQYAPSAYPPATTSPAPKAP